MAQLALGIIGGIIGGPVGFMIGSVLGSLLTPGPKSEGPRLSDLHLQTSQYGKMIPIPYGTVRIPGNVIWTTDLIEHKHTTGGKGGPQVTTYTYTASFAVQVCEGPIVAIRRIWADGTLIYDVSGQTPNLDAIPITIYTGTTTQLPDPTMESVLGVGNVPAHRGYCYVVLTDWDLGKFGNRQPSLNFEVQVKGIPQVPVFRARENHAEPYDPALATRWMFQWTGGYVGTDRPTVTQWPMSGSDIRVRVADGATVYTYAPDTFNPTGTTTLDPALDTFPVMVNNLLGGRTWIPVGTYVYADLSTKDIWQGDGWTGALVGTTTDYAAVGAGTASFDEANGGVPQTSQNFAFDAGVPSGEKVHSVTLTQDGKHCFIFTSAAAGAQMTKWYDIVDGTIARSGTVSPSLPNFAGGRATPMQGGLSTFQCSMFENNATYCWSLNTAAGSGSVSTIGSGSQATLYRINGGNFEVDPIGLTCSANDPGYLRPGYTPTQCGTFAGSLYVPADGYCGAVMGVSLVLFSRLGTAATPTLLSEIVGDLSTRAGLPGSQYDVTALTDIVDGYVIDQQSDCRSDILPLQSAYFFDSTERAGVMTFVKRGGAVALTIPDNDLAAQVPGSQAPALVSLKRLQELDLPATVNVNYIDSGTDYQIGTQYARRLVTNSQANSKIDLGIVMAALRANSIAWTLLMSAWVERERPLTISLPRKYWHLEPTDVVNAHGYRMRLTNKRDTAAGLVEFDSVADIASMWVQAPVPASGSGFEPATPTAHQRTNLLLLDIPLVTDSDLPNGYYAAMAPTLPSTWRGAGLYKSVDGGSNYSQVAASSVPSVVGTTSTVLGDFGGGNVFDVLNTVTVVIGGGGGELASATELAVLNGANLCLIGDELVQFKTATLVSADTYTLSGLLRGRRGTEWAMVNHIAGERFVLLPVTDVDQAVAEFGQSRLYKAVTTGGVITEAAAVPFTSRATGLLSYAPVQVGGAPITPFDGTVQIMWVRRTRVGGAWLDFADVPLSESAEGYVVQIWDSTFTQCARIITGLTTPACTYTAAQQVTDFGATQQTIFCTVGQIGAYRLGTQARGLIPGLGGSNTAPLSPIAPYNSVPPPPPGGCTLPTTASSFTWAAPVSQFNPNAGPTGTWVVSFTTGASVPGAGQIFAAEYSGPPTRRDAVLALSPCGAPLSLGSHVVGNTVSVIFYMQNNPFPTIYPTLLPSTTYYFSIDSAAPSGMICNLNTPH